MGATIRPGDYTNLLDRVINQNPVTPGISTTTVPAGNLVTTAHSPQAFQNVIINKKPIRPTIPVESEDELLDDERGIKPFPPTGAFKSQFPGAQVTPPLASQPPSYLSPPGKVAKPVVQGPQQGPQQGPVTRPIPQGGPGANIQPISSPGAFESQFPGALNPEQREWKVLQDREDAINQALIYEEDRDNWASGQMNPALKGTKYEDMFRQEQRDAERFGKAEERFLAGDHVWNKDLREQLKEQYPDMNTKFEQKKIDRHDRKSEKNYGKISKQGLVKQWNDYISQTNSPISSDTDFKALSHDEQKGLLKQFKAEKREEWKAGAEKRKEGWKKFGRGLGGALKGLTGAAVMRQAIRKQNPNLLMMMRLFDKPTQGDNMLMENTFGDRFGSSLGDIAKYHMFKNYGIPMGKYREGE